MQLIPFEKSLKRWDQVPQTLRDLLASDLMVNTLDGVQEQFHLSEERMRALRQLVRGVVLGFIHIQDLYKEIRAGLDIDNRIALEIYGELDKKVFSPYRKDIEHNFLIYATGGVPPVVEETEKKPQVVLKKEEPEVLNLRVGATAPQVLGQAPPSRLAPTSKKASTTAQPKTTRPTPKPVAPKPIQKGPMILHKQEDLTTVGQEMVGKDYKSTAFGGFGGAFKAPFMKKQKTKEPIAEVELPYDVKQSVVPKNGSVKMTKKKYEAPNTKTIHYSTLATNLEKPEKVVSPRTPTKQQLGKMSDDDNDEIIDLSAMTPQ